MNIGQWYTYNGTPASSTKTHKAGIDVMVVSQNQINNTSLVRIRPWIMKLSGSGFWHYNSQTMTIKANNSSKTAKIQYDFREATTDDKEYLTSNYPFKRISGSGSLVSGAYVYDFTITHDDDGTKTIPIYALIPLKSSNGVNWTVDKDIELPAIPRANTLKCSYTTLDEPIKFSISKASSGFTSTVNLSFYKEDSTELVGLGDIFSKTSSTSLTYTLTEEQLNEVLSYNKSKNIVVAFVSIITYNGSTQLGSNSYLFNIPLKQTNPIVSATYIDTNATTIALTGDSSKIVKYISKPKVTITAQAQQQADISSYSTIWGNSSSTTQETTFINGIDSNILQVSAKDSRKWVGNISYDITENYIEYIKLGFEKFTLERPETTSNTINANVNGVWFNGNFGVSTNTLELKFRYKERDGSYGNYQTISLTKSENQFSFNGSVGSSYNYQKQYDFEFVLSDKLMSLVATFNVTGGESIIRVAETYVKVRGDLEIEGKISISGLPIRKATNADTLMVDNNFVVNNDGAFAGDLTVTGNISIQGEGDFKKNGEVMFYDSGWIYAELTSQFTVYNNDESSKPQYRKIGKVVEIIGVVTPTSSTSEGTIFTLPIGFRPKNFYSAIMQGSGNNKWQLIVRETGIVSFDRYGTTSTINASPGTWLPFQAIFMVD